MAGKKQSWPPIVSTLTGFLLVFLVLPNPLRVPQNNPAAQAEYAPVPGNSSDATNANFSDTNAADSSGLGSNGLGEGTLGGSPPPPPPAQFKPRQKECVGNPPRQTIDPLSPPCVPFFDPEDDNFGKTYKGVTKDEIKVVLFNDLGVTGDMNQAYKPSDESAAVGAAPYEFENLVKTIKAQLVYFQNHFQTYGRTVHLLAQKSSGGITAKCNGRQGDAFQTRLKFDPFAVVHLGDNAACYFETLAKELKIPGFGLNSDVPRSVYDNNAPYVWGFFPDQESESEWSASFLCDKLWNKGEGKARFSKDPTYHTKPRKFGLIWQKDSERGTGPALVVLLKKYVLQHCGVNLFAGKYGDEATFTGGGQGSAANIITKFKGEGITTIVCYCTPVPTELSVSAFQNTATNTDYFPEWYWDHESRMFRAIWNQTYGDPKQFSMGVNHHWRNPAFRDQYWYKSYKEVASGEPNAFFNFDLYHLFLNLFEGIQAAGPKLTPDTVQRGMFTFNYLNRNDPYEPVGGYGPYDSNAVSDYTFVDTAMGWWWDPTGQAPGDARPKGCIRVIQSGKRFYANEWTKGDADINRPTDPCSQDDRKLDDKGGVA